MLKELIITIIIIIIIIRYKKSSHNFWISDDWWLREILVCKWNGRGKRGESRKFWKHDFKNRTDINCLMRRDNVGLFFLSTSPRSFFILRKTRFRLSVLATGCLDLCLEWVSSVCVFEFGVREKDVRLCLLVFVWQWWPLRQDDSGVTQTNGTHC